MYIPFLCVAWKFRLQSNPHPCLQMRAVVKAVARLFPTAIISGRGREKVEAFVKLKELFYAGSHGMDIVGPKVSPPLPCWTQGIPPPSLVGPKVSPPPLDPRYPPPLP